jgi:hypothetical protein
MPARNAAASGMKMAQKAEKTTAARQHHRK